MRLYRFRRRIWMVLGLLACTSASSANINEFAENFMNEMGFPSIPDVCQESQVFLTDLDRQSCQVDIAKPRFAREAELVDNTRGINLKLFLNSARATVVQRADCAQALVKAARESKEVEDAIFGNLMVGLTAYAQKVASFDQICGSYHCMVEGDHQPECDPKICERSSSRPDCKGVDLGAVRSLWQTRLDRLTTPDLECSPSKIAGFETKFDKLKELERMAEIDPLKFMYLQVRKGKGILSPGACSEPPCLDEKFYRQAFARGTEVGWASDQKKISGAEGYLQEIERAATKQRKEVCPKISNRSTDCADVFNLANQVQLDLLTDSLALTKFANTLPGANGVEKEDSFLRNVLCPRIAVLTNRERLASAALIGINFVPGVGEGVALLRAPAVAAKAVAKLAKRLKGLGFEAENSERLAQKTLRIAQQVERGVVTAARRPGLPVDVAMIYESCAGALVGERELSFNNKINPTTCAERPPAVWISEINYESCVQTVAIYGSLAAAPYIPASLRGLVNQAL